MANTQNMFCLSIKFVEFSRKFIIEYIFLLYNNETSTKYTIIPHPITVIHIDLLFIFLNYNEIIYFLNFFNFLVY